MKILNPKNIKRYILTFINVFKIFIISFTKFNKDNSIKFVFFYFPVKAYQENIIELAKYIQWKKY